MVAVDMLYPDAEAADLYQLADEIAEDSRSYLVTMAEVAGGINNGTAIPVLMLALSRVLVSGTKLGAITDVVPREQFEPDAGPDADIEPVRAGLCELFADLDAYADVTDPVINHQRITGSISNDLADVAADLSHGLRHHQSGQIDEALWWWQYSYVATWGVRASTALRVLQTMLTHIRCDVDAD